MSEKNLKKLFHKITLFIFKRSRRQPKHKRGSVIL